MARLPFLLEGRTEVSRDLIVLAPPNRDNEMNITALDTNEHCISHRQLATASLITEQL